MGILGRYVFTPEMFHHLSSVKSGVDGEIQLTDAMDYFVQGSDMLAWVFGGRRYDIGTMKDWFQSHLHLSANSDFSTILTEVIKEL